MLHNIKSGIFFPKHYLKLAVLAVLFILIFGQLIFPLKIYASTLLVNISANPSSGHAPLNDIDLTASVSGTATGNITYKFDCTNNGSWERTHTTSSTSYTATDLCSYSSPGTYSAKIRVERENLTFEGTTAIFVSEGPTLSVVLDANPSSGEAPLNDIDLTASVSGTATGDITYKFDCTSDGSWERTHTTSSTSYTASNLCDYPDNGTYSARVHVERANLAFQGTTAIFVQEISTLHLSIAAEPSSGYAPLNDVDLTAEVSGTATGDIIYKFDCTNNGSWERIHTTSSTDYTAYNLCDYSSPGVYAVKVLAERGGLTIQGTINVVLEDTATLAVDFYINPSSGEDSLRDVNLTAYVSGTATGTITYRFDCTNNGSWERTHTTSSTSYTASNLCDYYSPGTYTAKVLVERGGVRVEGTATILVFNF